MMLQDIAQHTALGRELTAGIDSDRTTVSGLADFPLAAELNTLGVPPRKGDSRERLSLVHRCDLYEALGAIDPNLIFAAPGPGMAGMIVAALGDADQQALFFDRFSAGITWSFFAMTERDVGTDAGAISLTARRVDGGYRLCGEKYLVGQGWRAPVGVVFAKEAEGPLGGACFLIEPAKLTGFSAKPLQVFGCRGANLSHMIFDDVFVADTALLGHHLRPTERMRNAASATFDALRPCVGVVALGVARGVLDRTRETGLVPAPVLQHHYNTLAALLAYARALCAQSDADGRPTREAGLSKVLSVQAATRAVDDVIARVSTAALFQNDWLCKAWRDIRAFEYAEGVSALHRTHSADLFRRLDT